LLGFQYIILDIQNQTTPILLVNAYTCAIAKIPVVLRVATLKKGDKDPTGRRVSHQA
jgi:hypothetical protein